MSALHAPVSLFLQYRDVQDLCGADRAIVYYLHSPQDAEALAGGRGAFLGAGMSGHLGKPFRQDTLRSLMLQHLCLA